MQRHLDEECDRCFKILNLWHTVLETVRREVAYNPSASAVRYVKSAYVPASRWRWLPQIATMARLAFDGSRQSTAAAVRSLTPSSRQFLYKAEPFVIDLRVESEPAQNRVWLMGQVLNSKKPDIKVENVDVILLSGEDLVAKTATNPAGEFELEFDDGRGLQLFINIRGQRAIGIVLPVAEI
ncbi:MAG: hypothetical protein ACR2IV_20340 [Bryobacteraceae bacterium]